jgi:hypothetical protein
MKGVRRLLKAWREVVPQNMTWLPSTGSSSGSHFEFVIDIDVAISTHGGSKALHIRLKLIPRTHSLKTAASKYKAKNFGV